MIPTDQEIYGDNYQLWHGDCLREMDRIESGSVDMILADLPYNSTQNVWDSMIPFEPLWKQYKRLIKKGGAIVLTASQPFTSLLVMSNLDWFKYEWIWDKKLPTGFLNANREPLRRHENILVFGDGLLDYYPIMTKGRFRHKGNSGPSSCYGKYDRVESWNDDYYPTSIIEIHNANQSEKEHSTQKPITLLGYLIRSYSNPGDLILDNCAGSGSTLEAAMRESRRSIGIELYPLLDKPIGDDNPDYFGIASKRLVNVARELRGEWREIDPADTRPLSGKLQKQVEAGQTKLFDP